MPKVKVVMSDEEVMNTLLQTVTADGTNDKFEEWLNRRLTADGPYPWHSKIAMQEKVNSLLRYELACLPYDTYQLRTYLEDTDPVEVWAKSIRSHVVGHLVIK